MIVLSCLMTVLGRVVVCFVLASVCVLIVTSAGSILEPKPVFESCVCIVFLVSPLCVACNVFRNISLRVCQCIFVCTCESSHIYAVWQQKWFSFLTTKDMSSHRTIRRLLVCHHGTHARHGDKLKNNCPAGNFNNPIGNSRCNRSNMIGHHHPH